MRKKFLVFFLFILAIIPCFTGAQELRPVIRFNPFIFRGLSSDESRFIELLIQSYVSDIGELVYNIENLPDYLNKSADYILSGSINLERNVMIFTLESVNTRTGETINSITSHESVSDLVLKARSIIDKVLWLPYLLTLESAQVNGGGPSESISEDNITGVWRVESGIEMIRLSKGGSGTAFFSSGTTMSLRYRIENKTLLVWQNSPNNESYYQGHSRETARKLLLLAEPMRWEMALFSEGTRLSGTKYCTEINAADINNQESIFESSRYSSWKRLSH